MKLLIIDHKARTTRGMPLRQIADAEIIVGKDRRVLKDRHGAADYTLTAKQLQTLRDEAEEVIERGEPLV